MTKRLEDYYSMLGIPRSVSQSDIRNAYLKAAKRLHPDKNVGPGENELFMEVQQAYQILSNPAARIAYDATLPPEEKFTKKINSHIMVSRSTLPTLTEKQLVYVLVEVSPSAEYIDSISEIPINLCLVLDCSTSMSGEKLNTIKETARQLVRKLKSHDIFSIVMFNDHAKVVIPAARQADLRKMENPIRLLKA